MPFDGTRTVADIIDEAANIIESRGHCQGNFFNSAGNVCMVNALVTAETGREYPFGFGDAASRSITAVAKVLGGDNPTFSFSTATIICQYNNAHTKDECIALLRRVAQEERAHAV